MLGVLESVLGKYLVFEETAILFPEFLSFFPLYPQNHNVTLD